MDKILFRNCRIIAGFKTRKAFAESLGVHPSSITRWESGKVPINKRWKSKVIEVLAEAGLTQDEIYLLSELKNKR
ncbi:hypothetical protein CHI12_16640 [Terribacillus saccharophilus]|uniref:HTH cro/C1-type domain-containing protein n=1 Tax=Terribacillus saccharophilus TaxID=361277 RepID=A0A268H944_9BACI|nr:helix-turn-helix transcriptional regulator [Terribacillus saccharophilus]PAE06402.1 hypothetical protein CHI12_16640 [Terribacillus saccharophilus]